MSSSPPPSLFDKLSFTRVPIGDDEKTSSEDVEQERSIPWPCLCFGSKEDLLATLRLAPFLLDGCCQQEDREEYIQGLEIQLTIEELEHKLNPPYPVKLLLGSETPNYLKATTMHQKGEEQRLEFMPYVSKFRSMYSSYPGFENGLEKAIPIMADRAVKWRNKFMSPARKGPLAPANKDKKNEQRGSGADGRGSAATTSPSTLASSSSSSSAGKKPEEGKEDHSSTDWEQTGTTKVKASHSTPQAKDRTGAKPPATLQPHPPTPLPTAAAAAAADALVKPPAVVDHGRSEATRPNTTASATSDTSTMRKQEEEKKEQHVIVNDEKAATKHDDYLSKEGHLATLVKDSSSMSEERAPDNSVQQQSPPPPPPPPTKKSTTENGDSTEAKSTPALPRPAATAENGNDSGVSVKPTAAVRDGPLVQKDKMDSEQQPEMCTLTDNADRGAASEVGAGAASVKPAVTAAAAAESPRKTEMPPVSRETAPQKTAATRDDKTQEEQNSEYNTNAAAVALDQSPQPFNWVKCDICNKWRVLVGGEDINAVKGDGWVCKMNTSDPHNASCDDRQRSEAWYRKHYFNKDSISKAKPTISNGEKVAMPSTFSDHQEPDVESSPEEIASRPEKESFKVRGESKPPTCQRSTPSKRGSPGGSTPKPKKARTSTDRKVRSSAKKATAYNDEARTSALTVTTIQTSPLRRCHPKPIIGTYKQRLESCIQSLDRALDVENPVLNLVKDSCAEQSMNEILCFMKPEPIKKSERSPFRQKALFVCGEAGGVGKTSTVLWCCNKVKEDWDKGSAQSSCLEPTKVYINASSLLCGYNDCSFHAFLQEELVSLLGLEEVKNKVTSNYKKRIKEHINSNRRMLILVVDELQATSPNLVEEFQTLLSWASQRYFPLFLIGISNTAKLDVYKKFTKKYEKITKRICFERYSKNDLFHILEARVGSSTVTKPALEAVSSYVADDSGNANELLELLSGMLKHFLISMPSSKLAETSSEAFFTMDEIEALPQVLLVEKLKRLGDGTGTEKSILHVLVSFAQANIQQTTIVSLKKFTQEYIESQPGEQRLYDKTFIQTLKTLCDHGFVSVDGAAKLAGHPSISDIAKLPVGLGLSLEKAEKTLMHEELNQNSTAFFKSTREYARKHRHQIEVRASSSH